MPVQSERNTNAPGLDQSQRKIVYFLAYAEVIKSRIGRKSLRGKDSWEKGQQKKDAIKDINVYTKKK